MTLMFGPLSDRPISDPAPGPPTRAVITQVTAEAWVIDAGGSARTTQISAETWLVTTNSVNFVRAPAITAEVFVEGAAGDARVLQVSSEVWIPAAILGPLIVPQVSSEAWLEGPSQVRSAQLMAEVFVSWQTGLNSVKVPQIAAENWNTGSPDNAVRVPEIMTEVWLVTPPPPAASSQAMVIWW